MRVRTVRDLGAAIKAGRKKAGWTQADLARRAGVARQWIVQIEKGKVTAEVGPILRTLAALGMTIELVETGRRRGPFDLDRLLDEQG